MLPAVVALGPDAAQVIYSNRNKDYSQQGWVPVIGPFFRRGLMLLAFEEHMFHRRIMQEAFVRSRLVGYVEHMDEVASRAIAGEWATNDARFLLYPAMKKLTLDIASMVFMGHEPGTDHQLVTKVNRAFTTTTRAGNAVIRTSVPPFTWWRGIRARQLLENYFAARVTERRGQEGNDLLTVLCHTADEDGNRFSDQDIVNHMIFLMMAAHDTSTSTATTMAYHLAAHPEWQQRCRDESDRLGDGPLDIEALEKLESLDLVMNESIRLVTPVQWAMRQTVRDTELLGYYLPKGTNVIAYPGMNHRLPEFWTDPMTFDPDRFAEPRNEHKRHRYAFTAARTNASAWCSVNWRSRRSCTDCCAATAWSSPGRTTVRAGTTEVCPSPRTGCRSCCVRSDHPPTSRAGHQSSSRLAQAISARSAD